MANPIELSLNPDGSLKLSDNGETVAGSFINRKVSWEIADIKIKSFKIISKELGYYPFEEQPNGGHGTRENLKVKFGKGPGIWKYMIKWYDTLSPEEKTLDPIISVKPTGFISPKMVVGITVGILAVLMLTLLLKKKNRK